MKRQNSYKLMLSGLLTLTLAVGMAQEETRPFQVSLIYPIGSNGQDSKEIASKYSLNIIAGHTGEINSLEIGGVYNITSYKVDGVQIAGFGNKVGGNVKGVQVAGFINTAKGDVQGPQIAGFSNISGTTCGVQVAGFNNHSKNLQGSQIAGFINTSGDVIGAQVAGFINVAKKVKGTQVGIINIADSISSGAQLGIINLSKKNGFLSFGLESDDFMTYRLLFRSGMNHFYTVLVAGIHPEDEYWSMGAGFGSRLFLTKKRKTFFNPEARWENINARGIGSDGFNHLTKLNLNLGHHFKEQIYITVGPSLNYYVADKLQENGKPAINLSNNQLINRLYNNKRHQLWIGYNVGLGFKF